MSSNPSNPSNPSNSPTPMNGATPVSDPDDVEKNKAFAVLAYLGILFLVPLIAAKDSPFARFHTNQGLVLYLASFAIVIPVMCLVVVPFVNFSLCLIIPAIAVTRLGLIIFGIVNAVQGKMTPLPIIGGFIIIK